MYIKKEKINYSGLNQLQWQKLRDILWIIIRHKRQPYKSDLLMSALRMVKDNRQREIFERYYFNCERIVSIAMDLGLTNRLVGDLLIQAVQFFTEAYDDGHLLIMFKEGILENEKAK